MLLNRSDPTMNISVRIRAAYDLDRVDLARGSSHVEIARGFSLIEIMVAMVIGLIGILVIFQVFAVSESYRRTTTTGGDAQQNGAISLYVLERELRQAGWGFNSSGAVGCTVRAYDKTQGAIAPYTLAPVVVTQGPANGSDSVEVNYGNQASTLWPTQVSGDVVPIYQVANRYGFNVGDAILVAEVAIPAKDCTLAQVTLLPTAPVSAKLNIEHDPSNAQSRYNKPGGSGVTYSANAQVFNLGAIPARNIYAILINSLVFTSVLDSPTAQVVADNIVQMKAQYGKDNGVSNGTVSLPAYILNDGVVDSYDNAAPTTTVQWGQVLAVRVGVVARSAQPEKPSTTGGPCDATTGALTWVGGNFDLSADPKWRCYRYKIFQTTVPVRNMLWSQG
jgi:type IV pilus assembly protein PilW